MQALVASCRCFLLVLSSSILILLSQCFHHHAVGPVEAAILQSPPEPSKRSSNKRLLILGFGPVGRAVAAELQQHFGSDWSVVATTRRREEVLSLENASDYSCSFTTTTTTRRILFASESIRPHLNGCSHLLVTIPAAPSSASNHDLADDPVRADVMECIASNLLPGTWLGLVSTTGVYGNHDNAWVTEDSTCQDPNHPYLVYEQAWRRLAAKPNRQCPYRVFRCAGLYGPERSALHTVFQRGYIEETTNADSTSINILPLTNRIHEHDVARAIVASMVEEPEITAKHQERIYNLADDEPAPRAVVMRHAADLLRSIHAEIPMLAADIEASRESSSRSRRRSVERKRVCNRRVKKELVNQWRYPTYREGLASVVKDRSCPWWEEKM